MMSELVDGSAWMKPPVEGPAVAVIGAAAAEVALAVPAVPAALAASGDVVGPPDDPPPPPLPPPPTAAANAARRTVASLAASALLRCTTQTLPLVAEPSGCTSSLAISERIVAILVALALRTISELLRGSTRIEVALLASELAAPGAVGVAGMSVRRWISGATSEAIA